MVLVRDWRLLWLWGRSREPLGIIVMGGMMLVPYHGRVNIVDVSRPSQVG